MQLLELHGRIFPECSCAWKGDFKTLLSPQVDIALVGDDADVKELRLRGAQLDEINAVFPVCLIRHGHAVIEDATDAVPFCIQKNVQHGSE